MKYLDTQLENIDVDYDKLIVAYEPVWAIGTGISASSSDIKSVHKALKDRYKISKLLYGGSVKVANLDEILSIDGVDGVLVGTASWEKEQYCKMLQIANKF